jgi:4-diphosphocytidyl-2-C-methyl-D-erythritol kinase
MTSGAIGAAAPAKVNLTLHICAKRADGYHLLDSLVVFAGCGDLITVAPAEEISLTLTGPFSAALQAEADNLVLRAARLLAATHQITRGAAITLEKNLPVASGIGGGSADAAATLRACGQLWNVDPHAISDADIAAKLGADVPVCLAGKPAFMSGIGERIAPAPKLPDTWMVLVNPSVPLSTKTVFGALGGRFHPPMNRTDFAGLENALALAQVLKTYGNSLMAPAREQLGVIGAVLALIETTPGCLLARLSGSGPTCFGLYASASDANAAAEHIKTVQPGWWAVAAPVLPAL